MLEKILGKNNEKKEKNDLTILKEKFIEQGIKEKEAINKARKILKKKTPEEEEQEETEETEEREKTEPEPTPTKTEEEQKKENIFKELKRKNPEAEENRLWKEASKTYRKEEKENKKEIDTKPIRPASSLEWPTKPAELVPLIVVVIIIIIIASFLL